VMMDTGRLLKMMEADYPDDDKGREACALKDMMDARLDGSGENRPSVECILHALFPQKYVLHLHPALVNGITCGKNGETSAKQIFEDIKETYLWVPLIKPGYILSKTCAKLFSDHDAFYGKYPAIVLLQNHGIFVAADETDEIDRIIEEVVSRINKKIIRKPALTESALVSPESIDAKNAAIINLEKLTGGSIIFLSNKEITAFTESFDTYSPISKPFTPDHIVYCNAYPLFIESVDDINTAFEAYVTAYNREPKIVVIEKLGVFALGKDENKAIMASELYLDTVKIAVYSESFGGPLTLPDDFTDFIVNWESESYRQKKSS